MLPHMHKIINLNCSTSCFCFVVVSVAFEATEYTVHEAAGVQTVCLFLSGLIAPGLSISVAYSTVGSTAQGLWIYISILYFQCPSGVT